MSLKPHTVVLIEYTKDPLDPPTRRHIVPTSVPTNIKAIDVSELSDEERETVSEQYAEYAAYLKQHMKQAFSFEDWLSQTKNVEFSPKWRTFKPAKTQILSE